MNVTWLEKCAQVGEFLYGIFPYEVLMQMYRTKESDKVLKTEVQNVINNSPQLMQTYVRGRFPVFEEMGYTEVGYITPYIPDSGEMLDFFKQAAEEGNEYAKLHVSADEIAYLLKDQSDHEFYIPTAEEIEFLSENSYLTNSYYDELKMVVSDDVARQIWMDFSSGSADFMEEIQFVIDQASNNPRYRNMDLDKANEIVRIVQEAYNHTNLRANRGWQPAVLSEKMGGVKMPHTIVPMSSHAAKLFKEAEAIPNNIFSQMGVNIDYNSAFSNLTTIGAHGEVRRIKIGRNDPCPCGSGKKYKKCCGRAGNLYR